MNQIDRIVELVAAYNFLVDQFARSIDKTKNARICCTFARSMETIIEHYMRNHKMPGQNTENVWEMVSQSFSIEECELMGKRSQYWPIIKKRSDELASSLSKGIK
jgi:hypothetical protein